MDGSVATSHRTRHDPSKSLVGFLVGAVHYAVPIARVKEVANPMWLVELPHAPPSVVGVAEFRGDVVPVVDLRLRFGLMATAATRKTKWIVVDVAGRTAALVVDSVTDVFGTKGADLGAAPALGGGEDVRGIAGVTHHGGKLVFVLDVSRLRELTDSLAASGQLAPIAHLSGRPSVPPT
jgi:purine-binding chemotaxis protein CheW